MNAPFQAFRSDDVEITLGALTVTARQDAVCLAGELRLEPTEESLARAIALRVCLDEVIQAIRLGAPSSTPAAITEIDNPF